jgi:la-related protein 4
MIVGDALKDALKNQVEFYFSKANLANDSYLVSQMNAQMYVIQTKMQNLSSKCYRYVPVEVIIGFSKIKQLTNDAKLVVEAIRDSNVVTFQMC